MVTLFGIQINTINGTQGYPFTGSAQEEVLGDAVKSSVDGNPEKEERPAVPCPRCNSPNTKFCYFNNYNVNQPRHFCKSCQRYWTAGGALRNVPEGSGCRKKTKRTPFEISKTARSAEFLRASSADVAPPNNQSLSTHSIRLPSPSPGEALPKVSNERLGSPEPYIEVIKPSPFHFPVGPCSNIGYGFKGVGLSHETRLWTTPPCSPIAKVALLGKHPRERLEIVETDGSTLIANTSRIRKLQEDNRPVQSSISSMTLGSEENRTNSLVSTAGTGGIFNGFPLTFEEPPIQALNDNPAAMNRLVSFQEGQPWNGILERKRSGMPQTSLEVSRKLMNL